MPAYNLPSFRPLRSPPPLSEKPPLAAPTPVRPAFVPLPLPRPSSPSPLSAEKEEKRGRRRSLKRDDLECRARTAGEVELPMTPPASPTRSERGALPVAEVGAGERARPRHSRMPSEGESRWRGSGSGSRTSEGGGGGGGAHHRRSSSVSTVSFLSPPPSPSPSAPPRASSLPGQSLTPPSYHAAAALYRLRQHLTRHRAAHPSPLSLPPEPEPGFGRAQPQHQRGRSGTTPPARPPRRPPLSKRYTRPWHLAQMAARPLVQANSVPRFSAAVAPLPSPSPSPSPSSASSFFPFFSTPSSPAPSPLPSRSPSPTPPSALDHTTALLSSLLHACLSRRLGERLAQCRAHTLGERAGLGGLKAGREMVLWAACVRVSQAQEREKMEREEQLKRLVRAEEAHFAPGAGAENGRERAAPLARLPGEEVFELVRPVPVRVPVGLAQARAKERGRGHSRAYTAPAPPPAPVAFEADGASAPPPPKDRRGHAKRLSALALGSLASLPALRRSISTPTSPSAHTFSFTPPPSPPPFEPADPFLSFFPADLDADAERPARPRRSHSDPLSSPPPPPSPPFALVPSFPFSPARTDDLPCALQPLLPRLAAPAILRPPASASLSSSASSFPSAAPDAAAPHLSLVLPGSARSLALPRPPRRIPLAKEGQRLLPSGFVLRVVFGGGESDEWEGGRSGRGIRDWSEVARARGEEAVA